MSSIRIVLCYNSLCSETSGRPRQAKMSSSITQLLADYSNGDESALDKLFPLVYDELHRLAASYMKRERPNHTFQTIFTLKITELLRLGINYSDHTRREITIRQNPLLGRFGQYTV
jgi:hypothetical protein